MALDNRRQTILDIYCHIYQKLVDYLEKFEQASDEYSCYAIVEKCFELAIQKFGESPPAQEQIKEALLTDLLKKIEGAFLLEYSSNDQLSDVLKAYKTDILNTPIPPANIEESQKIGEKLSQKFYQTYVPEYGGIKRQVELDSTLTPKKQNLPIFGHFSPVISDVPTTFFPISSTRCHWLIKFPT